MYIENGFNGAGERQASQGRYLSSEELDVLVRLMEELRDVTQSRRTFSAANEFLSRFSGEAVRSSLVPADVLEH